MLNSRFAIRTSTQVIIKHDIGDHPRKGYLAPDGKIYYHMIPKNASSYLGGILQDIGWQLISDLADAHGRQGLCLLREPLARWISGITEFMHGIGMSADEVVKDWNALSKILKAQPQQDAHTTPQIEFLHGMDLDSFDYAYMSEIISIGNLLYTYLNTRGYENRIHRYERQNTVDDHDEKRRIRDHIRTSINEDVDFKQRIQHYYADDYAMIEWVGKTKGWIH